MLRLYTRCVRVKRSSLIYMIYICTFYEYKIREEYYIRLLTLDFYSSNVNSRQRKLTERINSAFTDEQK